MAQFSVKIMRLTGSLLGENQQVVQSVSTLPRSATEQDKIDLLVKSLSATANGLINLRQQIGSVSAQITAANLG